MKNKFYTKDFTRSTYKDNGTLAVLMGEEVITVNLPHEGMANSRLQFIDTNNYGWDLVNWLEENKIATFVGYYGFSGYCTYPLMRFSVSKIKQL